MTDQLTPGQRAAVLELIRVFRHAPEAVIDREADHMLKEAARREAEGPRPAPGTDAKQDAMDAAILFRGVDLPDAPPPTAPDHGPNGVFFEADRALRFLAENKRPDGGNERYNTEHLYMIADELNAAIKAMRAELRHVVAERDKTFATMLARAEAAEADAKRLRGIIERERSRVADLVTRMKASLAQRQWLLEGRGNYAWDDDDYRKEFAAAVGDVRHVIAEVTPMAQDWTDCPTTADEVAKARTSGQPDALAGGKHDE